MLNPCTVLVASIQDQNLPMKFHPRAKELNSNKNVTKLEAYPPTIDTRKKKLGPILKKLSNVGVRLPGEGEHVVEKIKSKGLERHDIEID